MGLERDALESEFGTVKVRIFELAKEVGLTSKELTTLFNERLGGVFEAKNQLSVVPDQIADLVRSVLLKATRKRRPRPSRAAPSAARRARPPLRPRRLRPRLRRRPRVRRRLRPSLVCAPSPEARRERPPNPLLPLPPPAARAAAPAAAAVRRSPRAAPAPPGRPSRPHESIPQLRPVPAGQASIVRRAGAAAHHRRLGFARSRRPASPAGPASRRAPARRCPDRAAKAQPRRRARRRRRA